MTGAARQKTDAILARIQQILASRGLSVPLEMFDHPVVSRWLMQTIDYLLRETPNTPVIYGAQSSLALTAPEGFQFIPCRYAVVEASSVIPSHIPQSMGALALEPRYPPNLQERAYETDTMEAEKVRNNLRQFFPPLVVNTNPDAVNGPPIVDLNNFVLGGNSRAMTIQMLYASDKYKEKQAAYIGQLIKHSFDFGLTVGDVLSFQKPILIRVLDLDVLKEFYAGQKLVRLLNESLMQKMSYPQELIAIARRVSREGWTEIAKTIAYTMDIEDDSFSQYLQSRKSDKLIEILRTQGVFSIRNFSVYFDQDTKTLNRLGRLFVKDILLGHVFQKNRSLLDGMNDSQFDLFSDLSPFLIASACCDFRFDLLDDLLIAIKAAEYMKDAKHEEIRKGARVMISTYPTFTSIRDAAQFNLFYQIPPEVEAATKTIRRRFLWQLFFEYGTKRRYLMRGFQRYSIRAALNQEAQNTLGFDIGGVQQEGFKPETPTHTLLWAFQAKRIQQDTTPDSPEFELADQLLLENAPIYQGGSPKQATWETKKIRGKIYEFSYFNSYAEALSNGKYLKALDVGESMDSSGVERQSGAIGGVGSLRLLNPSHRFMPQGDGVARSIARR